MLLLIPILVFLLIALIMLATHLARPNFSYHWLIAMASAFLVWPLVLLSGLGLPQSFSLPGWNRETLFSTTYVLQADQYSWPIALALVTLVLAMLLSSAMDARQEKWLTWSGSCMLAAISLTAVQAGNPFTLLAAWTALDFTELTILLSQAYKSTDRQQIILTVSTRLCGSLVLIFAGVAARSAGQILDFSAISSPLNYYLYLAALLRIGVFPLHSLNWQPHKGLGVITSLITAGSGLILLIRTANMVVDPIYPPILLGIIGLAALTTAVSWIAGRNGVASRSFWILGMGWFVLSAAVYAKPEVALAWSLACLLPGGLLFLSRSDQSSRFPLHLLGLAAISTLPLTPSWIGINLYSPAEVARKNIYIPVFLLAHALFLAGYAFHSSQFVKTFPETERWVKASNSLGLALLPIIHFLLGWWSLPNSPSSPPTLWLVPVISIGLAFLFWMARKRGNFIQAYGDVGLRLFSFTWFFRLLGAIDKGIRRILGWINAFLEGEAGILWALLLLALIFSMLADGSPGSP